MFDDARFYNNLAENSKCYGKVNCCDTAVYLAISQLDFDNDLLNAIDSAEDYLL